MPWRSTVRAGSKHHCLLHACTEWVLCTCFVRRIKEGEREVQEFGGSKLRNLLMEVSSSSLGLSENDQYPRDFINEVIFKKYACPVLVGA